MTPSHQSKWEPTNKTLPMISKVYIIYGKFALCPSQWSRSSRSRSLSNKFVKSYFLKMWMPASEFIVELYSISFFCGAYIKHFRRNIGNNYMCQWKVPGFSKKCHNMILCEAIYFFDVRTLNTIAVKMLFIDIPKWNV